MRPQTNGDALALATRGQEPTLAAGEPAWSRPPYLSPAQLFNGYVGASVTCALSELGLFSALRGGVAMRPDSLAVQIGSEAERLDGLLRTAERLGYVLYGEDGSIRLTPAGDELGMFEGYFTWAIGGCGDVFRNLGALTRGAKRYAVDVVRDDGQVALGANQVDRSFMAPLLDRVLQRIEFRRIVDLGCGNGGRLIAMCQRDPALHAIGIDISQAACDLARKNAASAGVEQRVEIICADVAELAGSSAWRTRLGDVDVVTNFFMLHHLLTTDEARRTFVRKLCRTFASARYYLFADTCRMPGDGAADGLPIFSLGFELVHAFMGVPVHTRAVYETVFAAAELTIEDCVEFGAPWSWLYVLRAGPR